jgi:hypothetical protein
MAKISESIWQSAAALEMKTAGMSMAMKENQLNG